MKLKIKLAFPIIIISTLLIVSGCGTNGLPTQTSQTAQSNQMTSQSQPLQIANSTATAILNFAWVDLNSDMVSPTAYKPDGTHDGHFHITMNFAQPVMLKSIFLRYSGFGKNLQWDWVYDSHLHGVGYMLGVYDNGTLLKPGTDIGVKESGTVDLDLFASPLNNANDRDTYSFANGDQFNIEVNYVNQKGMPGTLRATATVNM